MFLLLLEQWPFYIFNQAFAWKTLTVSPSLRIRPESICAVENLKCAVFSLVSTIVRAHRVG